MIQAKASTSLIQLSNSQFGHLVSRLIVRTIFLFIADGEYSAKKNALYAVVKAWGGSSFTVSNKRAFPRLRSLKIITVEKRWELSLMNMYLVVENACLRIGLTLNGLRYSYFLYSSTIFVEIYDFP